MYYSDNIYCLLEEMAFQNIMLKQSLNQNALYLDSLLFSFKQNANSLIQNISHLPGQGQKSREQLEKAEKSLIEVPLQAERHFKYTLHQVNQKNKLISQQLLILQKHLEKKSKRSLYKNVAKEQQLRQEVAELGKRAYDLILKIQEFVNRIKYDEKILVEPPKEQFENFQIESVNLLTTMKNDYLKQCGILQKCSQKIKLFSESLE